MAGRWSPVTIDCLSSLWKKKKRHHFLRRALKCSIWIHEAPPRWGRAVLEEDSRQSLCPRKPHCRRIIENIRLLVNRQASQSTFHIVKILDRGAQKRKTVFFFSVPQSLAFAKFRIFLFELRLIPIWDLKVWLLKASLGWNFYLPHLFQFWRSTLSCRPSFQTPLIYIVYIYILYV